MPNNKIIMVTGAESGIGRKTSIVNNGLKETKEQILKTGGKVFSKSILSA